MLRDNFEEVLDRSKEKKTIERIICIILSLILALSFVGYMGITADVTPATFDDYVPLNYVIEEVENNPDLMLQRDGTITIQKDRIIYTIENEQCKLTGVYDKDFNLISRSGTDKSFSVFSLVLAMIIMGTLIWTCALLLLITTVYLIWFIVLVVLSIYKKHVIEKSIQNEEQIKKETAPEKEPAPTQEEKTEIETESEETKEKKISFEEVIPLEALTDELSD